MTGVGNACTETSGRRVKERATECPRQDARRRSRKRARKSLEAGTPRKAAQIQPSQRTDPRSLQRGLLILVALGLQQGRSFRLVDENGTAQPFVPYEEGLVGR